jgi:hypothetical protein
VLRPSNASYHIFLYFLVHIFVLLVHCAMLPMGF